MTNALINLATILTLKDETIHVLVYHRWVLSSLPINIAKRRCKCYISTHYRH